ncbi:hypothetical protein E3N88_00187 [Mikania micrantha]|uniref:NB-ARC domain-containing protein n=1 Tax=Mikania micrantha TaxID=192012 RepID=A0A5N6PZD3_9ASTR|nr:hypothetical protein E3N88_00187 [Mikania micrantha]
MEQTIYSQIVVPIVKFLKGHLTKHLGYVIFSSKYVRSMKKQLSVLEKSRDKVEKQKEKNNRDNKEIPDGVPDWLNDVETFKNEVESISSEGYGCVNIKMRYKTGKKACEATEMIKRFTIEKNEFEWTNAPIPTGIRAINSTPSNHGVNFKSRDRQFNEALKWLQQDNNKSQVIALCGMGGVGKTTMMEQLRMVANDKNMFDYIVPSFIKWTQVIAHIKTHLEKIEVDVLEEEEARNFFLINTNVSEEDDRYDIGCKIVEKCGRLPLAIKIIGTALHSQTKPIWRATLRRLENNRIDDIVQEVIKISYEYLKHEDKEVLLLCGLFPEDYDIQIEDLTRNAWGLNLFEGVSTLGDARDSTKTCVHNLINAHLLINSYEQAGCKLMFDFSFVGDLVNLEVLSFAWCGIGKLPSAIDRMFTESNIKELAMLSKQLFALEMEFVKKENLFEFFSFEKLDNFKIAIEHLDLHVKDMIDLEEFHYDRHSFSSLKCLMVYDCSNLKYLFPVCVANGLKKLEKLIIRACPVLEALINNDGSEINGVVELPQLLQLELYHLPNFTSIYPDSSSMCALFNSHSGEEDDNIHKVLFEIDLNNKQPLFPNLEKLRLLYMNDMSHVWWCNNWNKYLLLSYSSFQSLTSITIYECNRIKYLFSPLMAKLLSNLHTIEIDECREMEEVVSNRDDDVNDKDEEEMSSTSTTTTFFPHLHSLDFCSLTNLTHIGGGGGVAKEILYLEVKDMIGVEDILVCASDPHTFSSLKDLRVEGCSNLKYLFPVCVANGLKKLEILIIDNCPVMEALIQKDEREISGVVELPQLHQLFLYDLPNFTSIYPVNNNSNICSLFDSQVKFVKLEKLRIHKMKKLKQIWDSEFGTENNIFMLREIKVEKCDRLENLFPTNSMRTWNHLERLEVRDCGSIEVIFNIDLGYEFAQVSMNNLRSIDVSGSKNVRELWRIKSDEKNFMSICGFESVEVIRIEGCRNVFTTSNFNTKFDMKAVSKESRDDNNHTVAFPSILHFHSLRDLRLSKCEGMEVVFEIDVNNQQPLLTNLQRLELHEMNDMSHVWKCNNWNKYLFIPPQRRYSTFHSLTSITINKCNRIKYLFSPLMVKLLSKLQKIKIHHCPDMEEVVSNRDDDDDTNEEEMSSTSTTTTFFPHLQCLDFWDLTNLTRIGGGGEAKGTKTSVIQHKVCLLYLYTN